MSIVSVMPLYFGLRYTKSMEIDLRRQLVISLSIIVGSAIVAFIALYYMMGNISATADTIVKDKALGDQQTGALAIVAALAQEAPQAATYKAAMDKLIGGQDTLIGFNQWITNIANSHQVTATVGFGASDATQVGLAQMHFSLSASGGLNNVVAFLNDIEMKSSGFLIQLTSFTMTNNNGNYQVNSQGVVFYKQ
jgi:hypothetical protein